MKKIVALVLSLVMVLGLATTAFGADTTLYVQDSTEPTKWDVDTVYTDVLPAEMVVDADVEYSSTTFEQLKGNVEFYDLEKSGYVGIEVPKAAAEYKLVCGSTVVWLAVVPYASVCFEAEVEAFTGITNDEDACGSLYFANKKDLAKTYYVAYNEKGLPQAYYVKSATGDTNVLVGDEVVKANDVTDAFVSHDWIGNEVDAVTKAYTSLICDNCGRVAKLYANADAAGKYSVYEQYGWITAADAGYDVVVPSTPSTDKVTSAETFDAGIAMYVGMSVMAAAGSAVVIGKKKRED